MGKISYFFNYKNNAKYLINKKNTYTIIKEKRGDIFYE